MSLASNSENIRFNGTGRLYMSDVGDSHPGMEIGEIDGLSDGFSTSEDKIISNRTAARVTLATVKNETEGTLTFGMRELSIENLELAMSANSANTTSQSAGTIDAVETTMTAKEYVDVGKVDCSSLKLGHGTVSGGPFVVGETITGGTSSATGDVAWVGSGFVELVNVSGTFSSGETLTGGTSAGSAACSSVETMQDFVVVDAASPTVRYELGTDYRVDMDYGYIMKLPDGSIGSTAFVSCDYTAKSIDSIHAMSAGDVEKRLVFVTDADDLGPQMRYTYHRVKLTLNGDSQKIGDGESVLPMTGTILADTTRSTGEQYLMIEVM